MTGHWFQPVARIGYASRGVIYLVVGVFALLAAAGQRETRGAKGAISALIEQPVGSWLAWVLIAGLVGYSLWRVVQAVFDTDGHGFDVKGLAVRGSLLASAVTYGALAAYVLYRQGVFASTGGSRDITDVLADLFGSSAASLVLGAVFLGVAGAHAWKAIDRKYAKHFKATARQMRFIHPISMTGLAARGVTFLVVAVLLASRPVWGGGGGKPDIKDALDLLAGLPFGRFLLAAVGIGIVAFAAYSFIEARFRRINIEDASVAKWT